MQKQNTCNKTLILFLLISDFVEILEKAKTKGCVSVKFSNFVILGASGVGKSSLLNLLLGKIPICEHHSTAIVKAPEVCLVSNESNDDESSSSSDDGAEDRVTEVLRIGIGIKDDGSKYWISADHEAVKIKFLQDIKHHVKSQSDNTNKTERLEIQQPNENQTKYSFRKKTVNDLQSDEQSSLTSRMKKTQKSLPAYSSLDVQYISDAT